jgi:NADPH:quinone reductase-like Zn-dependent oxidoreductase
MKAAFFRTHGGPEVMEYGDFPTPQPGAGEVLVQIKAAALNCVDKWVRDDWPGLKLALAHVLGSDGAGVVAEFGPGRPQESPLQPGDRVAINTNFGCGVCEFCVAGQDNLFRRFDYRLCPEASGGAAS